MATTGLKPIDELVVLAKNGNGLAFTALWDRHIDQVRSYIKTRFKNIDDYAVDDICSRSFEKAFRQIHNYDDSKSQFLTWLNTIAKNTALDILEKEKRLHPKNQIIYLDDESQSSGLEGIPDQSEDALGSLIKSESEEERIKYIDRLP
ncbi:MAG: RNA polymerase sigma factor, partial [Bacteroidales bacterium]|nr:RNA polymerase sigma factor [Bacteroidales bacterium]